jgi:hypothetical protein
MRCQVLPRAQLESRFALRASRFRVARARGFHRSAPQARTSCRACRLRASGSRRSWRSRSAPSGKPRTVSLLTRRVHYSVLEQAATSRRGAAGAACVMALASCFAVKERHSVARTLCRRERPVLERGTLLDRSGSDSERTTYSRPDLTRRSLAQCPVACAMSRRLRNVPSLAQCPVACAMSRRLRNVPSLAQCLRLAQCPVACAMSSSRTMSRRCATSSCQLALTPTPLASKQHDDVCTRRCRARLPR